MHLNNLNAPVLNVLKSLLGTAHDRMVAYKISDQICVNKREKEYIYYKVTPCQAHPVLLLELLDSYICSITVY